MTIVAQMCLLVINSDLYSTFIGSIGGLTSQLLATSDLPTPYYPHSTLVIFGAFFLIGRIFARGISASIAKEEYRDIKMSERLHSAYRTNDYELIPFALNRIRMYLGLKKQKKIRHNVRFEGMITPLSRGSSFADGFDDLETDGHSEWNHSIYTEIDDFLVSDSESAVTKISDSSVWTTSKLISVNNQVNNGQNGQIEPLHMDYIIMKLINDSLPKLEAKVKQLESIYRDVDSIKEKSNLSNSTQGLIQGSASNAQVSGGASSTKPLPIKMSKRAKSEPIIVRKDSLSGNIFPGLRKSSTVMSSPKLSIPSLDKKPPEGKTAWEDLDNKFNKRSMRRKSLNDEQFKK